MDFYPARHPGRGGFVCPAVCKCSGMESGFDKDVFFLQRTSKNLLTSARPDFIMESTMPDLKAVSAGWHNGLSGLKGVCDPKIFGVL